MLDRSLGRKICKCAVEGRQSAPMTEGKRQQVRIGHLRVATQPLPGDVLATGNLGIISPEGVAQQLGDPS